MACHFESFHGKSEGGAKLHLEAPTTHTRTYVSLESSTLTFPQTQRCELGESLPQGDLNAQAVMNGGSSSSGRGRVRSARQAREADSAETPEDVATILAKLKLGQWSIPLRNIRPTEYSRQTSPAAVQVLVKSIRDVGWMPTSLPQITIAGLAADAEMTSELAAEAEFFALDGNHRLEAACEAFKDDKEKTIECTVYRDMECMFIKKIVSDACNAVSETHAKRTTMDQVFFYNSMIQEVLRQRGTAPSRKLKAITVTHLKPCWAGVKGSMPSDTTLRHWLDICRSFSTAAMEALKSITENASRDENCAHDRITKNFLHSAEFKSLHDSPDVQALYLHIYARQPKSHGAKGGSSSNDDADGVLHRAKDTALWVAGVKFVVPEAEWTDDLRVVVESCAFRKIGHYANYIKPHLEARRKVLRDIKNQLPQHAEKLDDDEVEIMLCYPISLVRRSLLADANLRPFLEGYDSKLVATMNSLNSRKLELEPPVGRTPMQKKAREESASGEGDGEEDEQDEEDEERNENDDGGSGSDIGREVFLCQLCKPPETSRYSCPNCKARHLGSCDNTVFEVGNEMGTKARPCKSCADTRGGSKRGRGQGGGDTSGADVVGANGQEKKRRTGGATSFPRLPTIASAADDKKLAVRAENTFLNEGMPLSPTSSEEQIRDIPDPRRPAMLVFLALGHFEHLLHDTAACSAHLKLLVYNTCRLMHKQGTIIVSVPSQKKWLYVHRVAEHLQQPGLGLVVEDEGLYVEYGSRAGGLTAAGKKMDIGGTVDFYLVAHHARSSADNAPSYSCDPHVTPQSFADRETANDPVRAVYGSGRRTPSPVMHDVPHKGPKRSFHDNVARLAIQRFTKQHDTVITLTADSDGVAECALHYGRRFEGFIATEEAREAVAQRIEDAWEDAWRKGVFGGLGATDSTVIVCPGTLPAGIPDDTTPSRVQALVKEAMADRHETGAAPSEECTRRVATELARNFGWNIKENQEEGDVLCLHAADGKKYNISESDIPIWGETVIYDTRQAALDSLDLEADLVDLQFVRLVLVADTNLLKRMCLNGKEVLRSSEAALYLKVAPSCPVYYAMWSDSSDGFPKTDIYSYLQRTSNREALVGAYNDSKGGAVAPARLGVSKPIPTSTPGNAVVVNAGVSIVRQGWCDEADNVGGGERGQVLEVIATMTKARLLPSM